MSDPHSNSVLFVLDELREIEDERVRDQRERELRLEAERRAQEQQLEEERRRLEAERAEMERRREEQRAFELQLAERRARIEAQMKLEEQRIALEMERAIATAPAPAVAPRSRWPWLLTTAAFVVLAAMQWMQWQVQQQIDRSLDDVRAAQAAMSQPVFIDTPMPSPALDDGERSAPTEPPAVARGRDRARDAGSGARTTTTSRPKPPETIVPTGIAACDDLDDPLGCMPKKR